MRKLLFITSIMMVLALSSNAQGVEITPFAGYTFGDKFPIEGGEVKFTGGSNYGGTLAFNASEQIALELTYSRVNSTGSVHSVYLEDDKNNKSGPVNTNYFLVGASRLFPLTDEVTLFAGLNLGGAFLLAPKSELSPDNDFKSSTAFAAGVNAGAKYFFNDHFGLRGQASLNFPVTSMGTGYWWDPTNSGTVGTTTNVPLLQFGFTAGIIYKISL
jgi:hypothetical protein